MNPQCGKSARLFCVQAFFWHPNAQSYKHISHSDSDSKSTSACASASTSIRAIAPASASSSVSSGAPASAPASDSASAPASGERHHVAMQIKIGLEGACQACLDAIRESQRLVIALRAAKVTGQSLCHIGAWYQAGRRLAGGLQRVRRTHCSICKGRFEIWIAILGYSDDEVDGGALNSEVSFPRAVEFQSRL